MNIVEFIKSKSIKGFVEKKLEEQERQTEKINIHTERNGIPE